MKKLSKEEKKRREGIKIFEKFGIISTDLWDSMYPKKMGEDLKEKIKSLNEVKKK